MMQIGWVTLRQRLLLRCEELKKRFSRHLGSPELAGDALHDTWLRLERGGDLGPVRSPDTYLFRVAINIGRDNPRAENRLLSTSDGEILLGIADETRMRSAMLKAVIAELNRYRPGKIVLAKAGLAQKKGQWPVPDRPHRRRYCLACPSL